MILLEPVILRHTFPREMEKLYLYPLSDCHVGSPEFDEKKFRGYCKVIAETPEAYCLFNGDLCNCGLPGSVDAEFWKQKPLVPQDQIDELVQIVKSYSIEDKILAVIGGSNHHARAMKALGHDYDKDFAEKLGVEKLYVNPLALIFLSMGEYHQKHKGNYPINYSIVITHGWAGGRTMGPAMNSVRELGAIYAADCFVVGHSHKDAVSKDEFYHIDYHLKTVSRQVRKFVVSGSFQDYGGYAMAKGMRPNGTGCPRIRFDGRKKDIHVTI